MTNTDEKDRMRRERRGALFKQYFEELNVTQTKFTDQINKLIVRQEFYLPDSKKISDWKSRGIPGPGTSMKARMRQVAVIKVLGIDRNSDNHKMLDGRMSIPHGLLDMDQPKERRTENSKAIEATLLGATNDLIEEKIRTSHHEQPKQFNREFTKIAWSRSLFNGKLLAVIFLPLFTVLLIGLALESDNQILAWSKNPFAQEDFTPSRDATDGKFVSDKVNLKLAGPEGHYRVQGVNPGGNAAYNGTVIVERSEQTYIVLWNIAGKEYTGLGTVKAGSSTADLESDISAIAIAFTVNNSLGVAFFTQQADGNWKGTWTGWGVNGFGIEYWTRM